NYAWSLQLTSQNQLAYFAEHGAGLDDSFFSSGTNRGLPAVHVPFLLTMRRKAGVITFFIDGEQFGVASSVLTTPTGATSGQLIVNQNASTAFDCLGLEIVGSALTDHQIRRSYDDTLGSEFGTLVQAVRSLWVGALRSDGASVVARIDQPSDNLRLALTGPAGTLYTSPVASTSLAPYPGHVARLDVS